MNKRQLFNHTLEILRYWAEMDFKGWDVYDGLNSKLFKASPFYKSSFLRWVFIQVFKVSPLNFRKLARVPKTHNPKGLALFILGIVKLYELEITEKDELKKYLDRILIILLGLKSKNINAWGYNFDWQARGGLFFPAFTPNVVVSYYVYCAYEAVSKLRDYKPPYEISDYIFPIDLIKKLKKTKIGKYQILFSYSPLRGNETVYNASLFASYILSRNVYNSKSITTEFSENILIKSINAIQKNINEDGSFKYGEKKFQSWVDNHHTLYIIEALIKLRKINPKLINEDVIKKSVSYYHKFFMQNEIFPLFSKPKKSIVDFHALGQLLRMSEFSNYFSLTEIEIIYSRFKKYIRKNIFYPYRINSYYKNNLIYIRWTQAFMFYGLTYFLYYENKFKRS